MPALARFRDPDEQWGLAPGALAANWTWPNEVTLLLLTNTTDSPAYVLLNSVGATATNYDVIVPANSSLVLPNGQCRSCWGITRLSAWIPAGALPAVSSYRPLVARGYMPANPYPDPNTSPKIVETEWNAGSSRWEIEVDRPIRLSVSNPTSSFRFSGGSGSTPATVTVALDVDIDGHQRVYCSGGGLDGTETSLNYFSGPKGDGIEDFNGTNMATHYQWPLV